jgi:NADPH:quinone reductase-like Zn-dependent oxidoreductase
MIPLAGRSYDVVIDTVGGKTLEHAFAVLRRGGRLVTLSAPPPAGKAVLVVRHWREGSRDV